MCLASCGRGAGSSFGQPKIWHHFQIPHSPEDGVPPPWGPLVQIQALLRHEGLQGEGQRESGNILMTFQRADQGDAGNMGHNDIPETGSWGRFWECDIPKKERVVLDSGSRATWMRLLSGLTTGLSYQHHLGAGRSKWSLGICFNPSRENWGRDFFSKGWVSPVATGLRVLEICDFLGGQRWSVVICKALWRPRRRWTEGMTSLDPKVGKFKDIREVFSRYLHRGWPT